VKLTTQVHPVLGLKKKRYLRKFNGYHIKLDNPKSPIPFLLLLVSLTLQKVVAGGSQIEQNGCLYLQRPMLSEGQRTKE
jgi:hypothetical protein